MYVWVFCPFTVGFHIAVEWMVSAGYCTNVMKGNVFAMCFMIQECEVPKLCSFYFTTARCFYGDYVFEVNGRGREVFGCGVVNDKIPNQSKMSHAAMPSPIASLLLFYVFCETSVF
jgi:hypothetical protein